MTTAIIVFLLVTLAFGGASMTQHSLRQMTMNRAEDFQQAGRILLATHDFMPPERRSMLVDPEGLVQRTADGTQMTRRDRSRPLQRMMEEPPAGLLVTNPETELKPWRPEEAAQEGPVIAAEEPEAILPAAEPAPQPAPLEEPIPAVEPETAPLLEEAVSPGRLVQDAIREDRYLSIVTKSNAHASSSGATVVLTGKALNPEEKRYVHQLAARAVGEENVDDRLTTVAESQA